MRRICPGCRTTYEENVAVCPRDGLPLLELSRTFTRLNPELEDDLEQVQEVDLSDDSAVAVTPGMMVGEYMIEHTIAEGGMGAIYAGIHPVISKRVAIKVINKRYAADPKAVARFVLEARSVNQIGHHNIVDIFSIGELDDRRNYLVMELLDGLSISHILLRARRLKAGQVLPLYEQLCDALDAAHRKGFIHRDLKPDNVVVLRRPPRPFLKILDFGLAKLRGAAVSHNTEVGTVLGTPEYMAPEQCRGASVDARTDIYALGVMLYELLTGAKPFTDPSPLRILSMHQHKPPTPPARLCPMSQALEQTILRAMAKDPVDRFSSVKDLLAELQRNIPNALPWPEDLVSWQQQPAQPRRAARLAPGDERRQDLMAALTPISISGEMAPLSGELEMEDDDNLQTLVSEPKQRTSPAPEAISGDIAAVDAQPEGSTDVQEAPALLPVVPADQVGAPEPALAPPIPSEVEAPESTLVDDAGPAVLVDRPLREARTEEAQEIFLRPLAEAPAQGGNGASHRVALAVQAPPPPVSESHDLHPTGPPLDPDPRDVTGPRPERRPSDEPEQRSPTRNTDRLQAIRRTSPVGMRHSARKEPERAAFPALGLIIALLVAAVLGVGVVLLIQHLR